MKICVYAICKNEASFVDRWVKSMSEADHIYVLDTGSTDNSVSLLKKYSNVTVSTKKYNPWRFDTARNDSLQLVPKDTDICVCTDLDEVFESGWREILESCWKCSTTKAYYNYNWSLDSNNKPLVNFYVEKIHARNCYTWTHPVHEVLTFTGLVEEKIVIPDITLNHYPDSKKSRKSYLPLLELSVKEDPDDDRNMHYLGREYMYYGYYNEAIDTLIKHLNLPSATWKDERCASMRFIARCYTNLNRYNEAKMWLLMAIDEAPYLRDPYVELAILYYKLKEYELVIFYGKQALNIKTHPKTYINETFSFDGTIYDIMAISYYNLELFDLAYKYGKLAFDMNPDDRLKNNLEFYKNKTSN